MKSIWSDTCKIKERPSLNQDIETDVLVIGAGMAGILTAYLLQEKGMKVIVVDANTIACGMTQNTTAKITSQHRLIYDQLIHDFGEEKAKQYAVANQRAIGRYRELVEKLQIDCHFQNKPAYVYSFHDADIIEKEVKAANQLGINAEYVQKTELPFRAKICAAVQFPHQAQFHPLEFIREVSKTLTIFEHTMVTEVNDNIAVTPNGKIKAKNIVIATHFPFINAPGYYFARMYQQRSYVIALKNAEPLNGMYIDADEQGYSFRSFEDYILFGGAGHQTGKHPIESSYEQLRKAAKEFYPNSTEAYAWSAQDCIPLDSVPYIGQYSASTPNLYVATGFKKWGMTSSMVAAELLADQIAGDENECSEVFSPQRFQLTASIENLLKTTGQAVTGLLAGSFKISDIDLRQIENGHGGVAEYEGIRVGVYKNEKGEAFIVSNKCPHLGCELEWNQDELSWDCPCHGSRYDYKGNLISNPAMMGLEKI